MKLMNIDSEHLGIPDTEYKATIKMPAGEFQRICRDLMVLGDTCESPAPAPSSPPSCPASPPQAPRPSSQRPLSAPRHAPPPCLPCRRGPPHWRRSRPPSAPPRPLPLGIIKAAKDGITFSVSGDMGTGNICCKQSSKSDEKEDEKITVDIEEAMELTFALRYLNFFTKATPLSGSVCLRMSPEVPLVTEYSIGEAGYVRYYLAPKIDEE